MSAGPARLIELGGPVVLILLGLSVLGAAVIIYKLIQLRGYSTGAFAALNKFLHNPAEPIDSGHPLGALMVYATSQASSNQPANKLEAELARRGNRVVSDCARYLRLVELIAYLSPLLGLLGTVLGMIEAFQGLQVDVEQANAGVLAGGIWEALLTTAVGLGIAIPMTAAHALLEGRVKSISENLQDLLEHALESTMENQLENPTASASMGTPPAGSRS